MNIEWESIKDGLGSVEYWNIIEPLGTFITIFPINDDNRTTYRVEGPQLDGKAEYSTLNRAKQVAEDLCRFSAENPFKEVPIDLRDYPNSGVAMWDIYGNPVYKGLTTVCENFKAPQL